jgi:hypothetical protein
MYSHFPVPVCSTTADPSVRASGMSFTAEDAVHFSSGLPLTAGHSVNSSRLPLAAGDAVLFPARLCPSNISVRCIRTSVKDSPPVCLTLPLASFAAPPDRIRSAGRARLLAEDSKGEVGDTENGGDSDTASSALKRENRFVRG